MLPIAAHWYDVEPHGDGIAWIDEPHVRPWAVGNIWLVRGAERSLVFDTGTGLGDLAAFVGEQVQGPVMAVASTGYFDHAGGLNQFECRAVHRLEAQRISNPTPRNTVSDKYLSAAALKALPWADFVAGDYCMPGAEPTELLDDGSTIDLGDRRLEVVHVPGITDGSIALHERKTGLLFGGESLSDSAQFYSGEPAEYTDDADTEAHRKSMRRLYELDVSTVYPGHGSPFDARRMRQILESYLFS